MTEYDSESQIARTTHLSPARFRSLYQSTAFANCDGLVLNRFITISWEAAGKMTPEANLACHQRLLENMRTWFYDAARVLDEEPSFACIWVRENGAKYGVHSHILVHVWPDLDAAFVRWLRSAVAKIARKALGQLPDVDHGKLLHPGRHTGNSVDSQWRAFRYMMKGLDPNALVDSISQPYQHYLLAEFGKLKISNEGVIIGPRCGASRQLGPQMQKLCAERYSFPALWPEHHSGSEFLPYDDRHFAWHQSHVLTKKLDRSMGPVG